MRLSDLQSKDIVNVVDGRNIGNIIDAKVDISTGNIISLIIESKGKFMSFNRGEDTEIKWQSIERIGEDVILVKLN